MSEDHENGPFSPGRVAILARAIRDLPPGQQAQLRRLNESGMPPAIFYHLLLRHVPEGWNGPEYERRWQYLMQGMAIMALSGPVHADGQSPGRVLGSVLSESAEPRFWRLLEADEDVFYDVLRHMVRQLAHAARPVDWADMARLCLYPFGGPARQDVLRRMARDFMYARQHSASQGAAS